ncbi:MAG: mandelate racemase/muconate lactonizing enzyme family protein [Chloroflexi bacterium]|nr:mandelate racemase/muconate lactonizing enzyme family protein [Chloroflexota bacterium]MCY4246034.1 mandelate racemase/muconate lactonizing enzyme family protein [Chloroflexota bacterium]
MKITGIAERVVPIKSAIRNAFIDFSQMTVSVVGIRSDIKRAGKPLIGYGFNSNGRYSQSGLLRDRFIPRLLNAPPDALLTDDGDNFDPAKAWDIMMANEKPGGHGERSVAVGVLDMALWDLVAKIEGLPLYRLLGERYRNGKVDKDVFVYAAGGYYYPGKDLVALQDELKSYLDMGYTTVKIKIGGASLDEDCRRIEAALAVLGEDGALAVDANGRFTLKQALDYAESLEAYDLFWYEEPGDPLDYRLNAALASVTSLPLATGENLFSTLDAQNLVRYGGMRPRRDFLQMDPALSYGLVEYLRLLDMLAAHGWSARRCIPHGGHQFALHIAAGLGLYGNESYPHVFQPFGGFGDDIPVRDGRIQPPQTPGIGMERKADLLPELEQLFA